jgi:hypothetical protein
VADGEGISPAMIAAMIREAEARERE